MLTLIKNANIILDGKNSCFGNVLIKDNKIVEITDKICDADIVYDAKRNYLLPGLIDIHFHGSYGYDFIENAKDAIDVISSNLVKEGTTSFMASLTVVSHKELCSLLYDYSKIKETNGANFLGVHSEGPYLSVKYKALMDERYLRDPDINELEQMLECAKGVLKIMTIAPERKNMDLFIQKALDNNITLMIGHSDASCDIALNAIDMGCTGFTHLYNAMSQHVHREPGNVTAAFLSDKAYCEMIVDGFHIHPDVVKASYNILKAKRICLITDAMLGKGMPDGEYVFSNLRCIKKANTVRVIETGRIAGSSITMLDAIKNMRKFTNCSLNEIVQMACVNPSIIAKVDKYKGSIEAGKDADLIILNNDLDLMMTMVNGKIKYSL
ncbi:MAG: N-acetylglucosamine-6-phosphate deacetylase [Firmicutes bacterium]|nr:N-acetylglucosamine-6-phosphate deacetylase [Bacillota bacterium]